MTPVKQTTTPKGLTPQLLIERISAGDTAATVLKEFKTGYALVARWRQNNAWFAEEYPKAMRAGHPGRIPQPQFDALYPGWKEVLLATLDEQSSGGGRASLSGAVARLHELGYPITMARIYALRTSGSRFYDEEFAMAVETLGSAETVNRMIEMLEENLLEGKDLKTALSYLKARTISPLKERSRVSVSKKETKELVHRQEVRVTIAQESAAVGQQIQERIKDVSPDEPGPAEVRRLTAGDGTESPGSRDDEQAQVEEEGRGEEEVDLEEAVG